MSAISELLDDIKVRSDRATAAPWMPNRHSYGVGIDAPDGGQLIVETNGLTYPVNEADAVFIATARAALPATADALRAARRVITEAIQDVTVAYADQSRSAQARAKSDVIRRALMTLRDDTERAIAEALGVQP